MPDAYDELIAKGLTLDDLKAQIAAEGRGAARKLTFAEQCGAFAALYGGAKPRIIARAFGISSQSVSYLSGCLESDPDPYRIDTESQAVHPKDDYKLGYLTGRKVLQDHDRSRSPNRVRHYPEVRREFEALGPEEFARRYYNERTMRRIMIAKDEMRQERRVKAKSTRIWKDPRS